MSIVNITIGKERALVGCDTACLYETADGGERGEMTKLVALQGTGVVMAYRGESHIFKLIFSQCFFGREPENFDDLAAQMPALIRAASRMRSADRETDLTLELYVVGWSPQRGRMAGAAYVIDAKGILTDEHVDTWMCASSPELPGNPSPLLDTHEAMFEHARRQTVYGTTEYTQYAIGGRFFIADLTRERVAISCVGNL